jgi:hypothetical protein
MTDEYLPRPIPYPNSVSEFEVQAFLMFELRAMGHDTRGEVKCKSGRLDLVVFKDMWPIRVIEVKKHRCAVMKKQKHATGRMARHRQQVRRYCETTVPVDVVASMRHAKRYIADVKEKGFAETNQWYW